jgi:hypothetical protein
VPPPRQMTAIVLPIQNDMALTCPADFLQLKLESGLLKDGQIKASQVYGRADYRGTARARGRCEEGRFGTQTWRLGSDAV